MPTIFLIKGYRFFFFSADRDEPPHVHVKKGDGDGKIWLLPEIKPEYFFKFKTQEEKEILKIIIEHKNTLISKWYEYFEK